MSRYDVLERNPHTEVAIKDIIGSLKAIGLEDLGLVVAHSVDINASHGADSPWQVREGFDLDELQANAQKQEGFILKVVRKNDIKGDVFERDGKQFVGHQTIGETQGVDISLYKARSDHSEAELNIGRSAMIGSFVTETFVGPAGSTKLFKSNRISELVSIGHDGLEMRKYRHNERYELKEISGPEKFDTGQRIKEKIAEQLGISIVPGAKRKVKLDDQNRHRSVFKPA